MEDSFWVKFGIMEMSVLSTSLRYILYELSSIIYPENSTVVCTGAGVLYERGENSDIKNVKRAKIFSSMVYNIHYMAAHQQYQDPNTTNPVFLVIIISALAASTVGLIFLIFKGGSDLKDAKMPIADVKPTMQTSQSLKPTAESMNFDIVIPDDVATPPSDLEGTPAGFIAF